MPGFDETENVIKYRIKEPGLFQKDSFRVKEIDKGISLVLGKLKNETTMTTQSIMFDKEKYDLEKAKKWIEEHKEDFEKKKCFAKTYNINNVEIFATGKWNGDTYTEKDLDEIVKAFNETKNEIKPFLKLGHDPKQKLLQKDGYPSAGWITNLKKVGNKIVATFSDVPEKVYQLIKNKAYKTVSSEIFWNLKHKDKTYKRLLSAVALLGSDMPAVTSLSDILNLYGFNTEDNFNKILNKNISIDYQLLKTYTISMEDHQMEEKVKELESQLKEYKTKEDEWKSEKEKLETYKKELDEKLSKVEEEKHEAEIKKFVSELESQEMCTPAMKEYITEYLNEDKKEYTIKEKKYDKKSLLAEILKLFRSAFDVNFDESSEEGERKERNTEEVLDKKIHEYSKEHDISYTEAYKEIINKLNESEGQDE